MSRTLLETLQDVNFLRGVYCPYTLFVTLCHIAEINPGAVIEETESTPDNEMDGLLAGFRFEPEDSYFNLDSALAGIGLRVTNEKRAAFLVGYLLTSLDRYLAGMDSTQHSSTSATSLPNAIVCRLNNPFYYIPIEVKVGAETASYVVAPRIAPLWANPDWREHALTRSPEYYAATIDLRLLRHHTVVRDGKVCKHPVRIISNPYGPHRPNHFQRTLAPLKNLSIGLAPCDGDFIPAVKTRGNSGGGNTLFRFMAIDKPDRGTIRDRIIGILTSAQDNGVDVLVFPELSVDHDAHTDIRKFLAYQNEPYQLKLVVAGSFHKEREEGGYANVATMLDWAGNIVWKHSKQKRFVLTGHEIEKSSRKESIRTFFGCATGEAVEEDIYGGAPMVFLDTPIGRMTTVICLDYLLPAVKTVASLIACSYFWVPVMTAHIEEFVSAARDDYGKQCDAVTACCASQACCEMIFGAPKPFSFLYAPSRKCVKPLGLKADLMLTDPPLLIYRLDKLFR